MKIFCLGQNYIDHAKEMGFDIPTEPVIFMKPPTAYLEPGRPFEYPSFSKDAEYELEIVLKMDKKGKNVSEEDAKDFYSEITVGIDFTARDLQHGFVKKGLPWEIAKGFDGSAFVGEFISKPKDTRAIDFKLLRNGHVVQEGHTKNLIFSFEQVISYISKYFTIEIGDIIYTGTPVGVGDVARGDSLEGYMGEQKLFTCSVV
jgi:acylpyruvate hydrolase